jgi:hypothetical protein
MEIVDVRALARQTEVTDSVVCKRKGCDRRLGSRAKAIAPISHEFWT